MRKDGILICFVLTLCFISSEISAQVFQQPALYTIGGDTICSGLEVNGRYQGLLRLTAEEYITITVIVSAPGSYSIATNTVNGYRFTASGIFPSTGVHKIHLSGTGIPVNGQIDQFSVIGSGPEGSCTFSVIVLSWRCGRTFTDTRDSQNYHTVLMGTQCWMAHNLNIGTQISSLRNQKNDGVTEKFCYNGNEANCRIYGGLYQWDELMNYAAEPGGQGLCPAGWHIPTDEEWCILTRFIDPSVDCNTIGVSGTNCGGKMKETGTRHWASPNEGATNSSEFDGLPSGYRDYPGSFNSLPYEAFFWTSTECGEAHAWNRGLHYYNGEMSRDDYIKSNGFAARCVHNYK